MKQFFIFILLYITLLSLNAQVISSRVIDAETAQPLQYATIAIKNTGKGTITNEDGYFRLNIARNNHQELVVSYIGYETKTFDLKDTIPTLIYLKHTNNTLQTVTVLANQSVHSILRKAYNRIGKNYPQELTKQIAFYRSNNQTSQKEYIYVSEGILEAVKSKYTKAFKNDLGQVKVLKGRTNYLSHIDWASKTRFIAGHLYWSKFDIVKRRMKFIHPKYFDDYHYELMDTTIQDGKAVYVIAFDNRDGKLKGRWDGKLYIDSESYAYIRAEFKGNALGIKKRNWNEGTKDHQWKAFSSTIRYKKIKDRWHLSSYIYEARVKRSDFEQDLLFKTEFIVTETITDNVKPLAFEDRLEYTQSFSKQVMNNFEDSFFDNYTVLEANKELKKQIKPLRVFKSEPLSKKSPLEVKTTSLSLPKKKPLSKEDSIKIRTGIIVSRVLARTSIDVGLVMLPFSIEKQSYTFISLLNNDLRYTTNSDFSGNRLTFGYYSNFYYDITKHWTANFGLFSSLSRYTEFESYDIGIRHNFLLKKIGKPIVAQPSLSFWWGNMGVKFEDNEQEDNVLLRISDDSFDNNRLSMNIGKRFTALRLGINVNYWVVPMAAIQIGFDYFVPLTEKNRLFVQEDTNNNEAFLSARRRNYDILHEDFLIEKNAQSFNGDLPFQLGRYALKIGLLISR